MTDIAPILAVKDGAVDITITVPGRDEVTDDDVTVRPGRWPSRDPVRGRTGEVRRQGSTRRKAPTRPAGRVA